MPGRGVVGAVVALGFGDGPLGSAWVAARGAGGAVLAFGWALGEKVLLEPAFLRGLRLALRCRGEPWGPPCTSLGGYPSPTGAAGPSGCAGGGSYAPNVGCRGAGSWGSTVAITAASSYSSALRSCSRASSSRRSISSSAAVAFPAYLRRVIQSSCHTASMVSGNRHHPGTYVGRVAGATPRLKPTTGGMLAGGEGSTEAPTAGVGCGDGWSTWVTTWGSGESCRPGGSAWGATGALGAGAGSCYEAGSSEGAMGASGCSAAAW